MEAPKNDQPCEKIWNCNRCKGEGAKMCFQHSVSYLFPINKKNNFSTQSGKIEEKSTHKIIPAKIQDNLIDSKKADEEQEAETRRKVASQNVEEQVQMGDKEVDTEECIPELCENGAEKKRKVAPKLISIRLLESLTDVNKNKGGGSEQEIPVRAAEEEGEIDASRKRRRKITEKVADFLRGHEGHSKRKVERKRRKSVPNVQVIEFSQLEEEDIETGIQGVRENGAEEKQANTPQFEEVAVATIGMKKKRKPNDLNLLNDETVGIKINLNTCHQCHRNDKGRVIKCTKCKNKRFCIPCITTWYPHMTEEQIALACPICLGNCNCKSCLRMEGPLKNRVNDEFKIRQDEKIDYSKYLLRTILPCLKQFNLEQMEEKQIEAKIQGILVSEVELQRATFRENERVFCNNCRSFIIDFHRSCPKCKYNLCVSCCREARSGELQGCGEVILEHVDRELQYLHGKKSTAQPKKPSKGKNASAKLEGTETCKRAHPQSESTAGKDAPDPSKSISGGIPPEFRFDDQNKVAKHVWNADKDGAILCPPPKYEGCGGSFLELKSILSDGWVSELLERAEQTVANWGHENASHVPDGCLCSKSDSAFLQKCASREGSNDNDLYCPDARNIQHEDLKHFQHHWIRGEPVIVRSVLETTPGLSWEPMVMWRAFRQIGNRLLVVKAINCLDWSEVDLNAHQFFKDYSQGHFDGAKQPAILKLKDWPPNGKFEQRLPRHSTEFIRALPFKAYTHPRDGVLNLASKWTLRSLKPDLGPKTHIAYGRAKELGCGDSVTKLHSHLSDVVNILVHTAEVSHLGEGACPPGSLKSSEHDGEGAVWDIFRREDVLKLQEYLRRHYLEFRHYHGSPLNQVIHLIHDQTFYFTQEHKRLLKEECGIEPWTFVQKLGEAVFIPAGCPHQVRNLKSCIKVALDFVSPENVHESIRLTEELRSLPHNHQAKEDKLEVRRMIIHAVKQAISDLESERE